MTDQKPCKPECRCECGDRMDYHGVMGDQFDPSRDPKDHAPACPNAEPAPAPKGIPTSVSVRVCGCPPNFHLPQCGYMETMLNAGKPTPAEAPKAEEKRCTYCRQSDPPHLDRECNSTRPKPAPAEAPKVVEYDPNCGACKIAAFTGKRPQHIHFSDNLTPAPAPESVTPASDQEITDTKSRAIWDSAIGSVRALKLIARIEQEQAANAELRAQVKRCHALLQGFVSCTDPEAEPELCGDASKELGGEFCPGSCTTSCDADRDVDRAEIESLRARLAEVSEAAANSLKVWGTAGAGHALRMAMTDLEAILAKGDSNG